MIASAAVCGPVAGRSAQRVRRLAALIAAEAGTLGVVAGLHLSETIAGGKKPFDPDAAGIAEAVIGAVLLAGAAALLGGNARGRITARLAVGFAIVGFVVGLTFTTQGGDTFDIAYHATMLPVLIATAWWLRTSRRPAPVLAAVPP